MYTAKYKNLCVIPPTIPHTFLHNVFLQYSCIETSVENAEACIVDLEACNSEYIAMATYIISMKKMPVYIMTTKDVPKYMQGLHVTIGTPFFFHNFMCCPEEYGRIFVIEGGDGAGKQTQSKMLVDKLKELEYPVKTFDFPNDDYDHGALIREVLAGKYGELDSINPFLFGSLYAQNRYSVNHILKTWIDAGFNIILDRYTISNFAHQAARDIQNTTYIVNQLDNFEHEILGIPRAHSVIYLDIPPKIAHDAMKTDLSRTSLDLNETASNTYKNNVRQIYIDMCEQDNYTIMPCMDYDKRISKEIIAERIFDKLQSQFVNKHMLF